MDDLPAGIVVRVLRACGVSVSEKRGRTIMVSGSVIEVQRFTERVPRRMVLRIAYKFGVPPHYFWHPEMMPGEPCDPEKPAN